MPTTYQIVALSSLDPGGSDTRDEPKLVFPDALKAAQVLKNQGKAFRVFVDGEPAVDQLKALNDLGAIE
ncbi:hypothetical protein [Shinella sedimenti]|uniref:Uncharacterized protein n=1 Tax=Shinella sedimenti TaxID=2919913 RepID=A0ABT0CQL7_9HYPH|nr:hypothetical protein [Shinella sedimenti]MCJ8150905.1 hypothetical protein [Shinella sedimenti]